MGLQQARRGLRSPQRGTLCSHSQALISRQVPRWEMERLQTTAGDEGCSVDHCSPFVADTDLGDAQYQFPARGR